jgi:hypothetical protein
LPASINALLSNGCLFSPPSWFPFRRTWVLAKSAIGAGSAQSASMSSTRFPAFYRFVLNECIRSARSRLRKQRAVPSPRGVSPERVQAGQMD